MYSYYITAGVTAEDLQRYHWNTYHEDYFHYGDYSYTPQNAVRLFTNIQNKTVVWPDPLKSLSWAQRHKAFTIARQDAENYSYAEPLVLEYNDTPVIDIDKFDYFMAFVDICLHMAESTTDAKLKRQYITEAECHYKSATKLASNENFNVTLIARHLEFLREDTASQDPQALPARLKQALDSLAAPKAGSKTAQSSIASRAKNPPLTISAMAKGATAPRPVAPSQARVTPVVARPAPVTSKVTAAKPAPRPGLKPKALSAQQALEQGEFATAVELFEKLCTKEPSNIEAFIGHGQCLLKLATECDKPKTRKKQLLYAEEQLKKAESLDKRGRYPKVEELLLEVEQLLGALAEVQLNTSPNSSATLTGSSGSNEAARSTGTPTTLTTSSNYEISFGHVLGEGAAGRVYQGTWNGTTVAIKEFHATQLRDDDLREFLREASFMMDLNSPYLVKMHDFVAQAPHYCMVMEYMPLGSLYQVLGSKNELPLETRWAIGMDILCGVAALHSKDIVHRDIKSLNILIGNGYRAKLADFWQAKLKSSSKSLKTRRTETGAVGTTAWTAPEIITDQAVCSQATDMYSVGMVLWELFTRLVPFSEAQSEAILLHWISLGKREDISKVTQPKVSQLILSCWQTNPSLRPTAQKALNLLEEAVPTHVSRSRPRMDFFSN